MKKHYHIYIFISFIIICNSLSAQNFVPFTPHYDQDIHGDMLVIGNNILNRNLSPDFPNDPYNGTINNSSFDMQYIDIDGDPTTFSSSSADLDIPSSNCYKIAYAGLYWGAILQSGSRTDINKVKFKLPSGNYVDITGQIIYDANTPIGPSSSKPYVCFADVTSLITPLSNPEGTYTLANVISSVGSNGSTGLSAGWTLFIVYEDPNLPKKAITSFDGFSGIDGSIAILNMPMYGFRTPPVGPVKTKFAFSALEGDLGITGDNLKINGITISSIGRPVNNFFNSTLTTPTGLYTTRNPSSSNTLGVDAGIINISNPLNSVITNNATSATIRIADNNDVYFYYFNAFANEIIEPNIITTMVAQDIGGTDISGGAVNLAQDINYIISFQNTGNDNVSNFTIKDIIPANLYFDPASLSLPGALPAGVTFIYNPATRTIIFTIPNSLVKVGDPKYEINIKVNTLYTCNDYSNACSNFIQNQAFASYFGTINTSIHSDEPSNSSNGLCNAIISSPTEFSVNLGVCDFTKNEIVCDHAITLSAADGYASYIWTGPGTITPVVGTNNQSVMVSESGIYTVNDQASTASCVSILETFNVASCYPSNGVIQNGNKLSAVENNATYQWIDCDNGNLPILNETNQFFEPTLSGNYAVVITNAGNYQVTSACVPFTFLGTPEFEKLGLKLYPNPITDTFYITGDIKIKQLTIYNLLGQQILKFNGENTKEYSINKLQTGTYLVRIETEKGIISSRIIKN